MSSKNNKRQGVSGNPAKKRESAGPTIIAFPSPSQDLADHIDELNRLVGVEAMMALSNFHKWALHSGATAEDGILYLQVFQALLKQASMQVSEHEEHLQQFIDGTLRYVLPNPTSRTLT